MLNLSADLVLVVTWPLLPGFPVFLLAVTMLPQNRLETAIFVIFMESMHQELRKDRVEWVVFGLQAWSFNWKG